MTTKEEINCFIASAVVRKQYEIVDAMFANPKLTDEDIAAISGFPVDEIAKRRAERQ